MDMFRAQDPWLNAHVPQIYMTMLETAETVAERYGVSREAQDDYALQSQNRTAAVVIFDLWEEGSFLLLSAFAVLMFIVLMALSAVAHAISRRFGVQEQL